MYVVRRAFRNYGQTMLPGSVVEPGNIKRFKTRLKDRFIVEVTEQDFSKWNAYFVDKVGTPIQVPDKVEVAETVDAPAPKTVPVKVEKTIRKPVKASATLK